MREKLFKQTIGARYTMKVYEDVDKMTVAELLSTRDTLIRHSSKLNILSELTKSDELSTDEWNIFFDLIDDIDERIDYMAHLIKEM